MEGTDSSWEAVCQVGCEAVLRQAGLLWTFSLLARGDFEWPASCVRAQVMFLKEGTDSKADLLLGGGERLRQQEGRGLWFPFVVPVWSRLSHSQSPAF